jgi:putative membrane protein
MPSKLDLVVNSLTFGLPLIMLHFFTTVVLLIVAIACYVALTPFRERPLVASGNVAAGVVSCGTTIALAIPLAATLATSASVLDIVVWGIIALILQLVAFGIAVLLIGNLRAKIEAGNVATALTLVGIQIAVALLNAGAMAG